MITRAGFLLPIATGFCALLVAGAVRAFALHDRAGDAIGVLSVVLALLWCALVVRLGRRRLAAARAHAIDRSSARLPG